MGAVSFEARSLRSLAPQDDGVRLELLFCAMRRLLQVDGLVAAILVELRAPYPVRPLMLGRTEADARAQAHVEVAHAFQRVDQILRVELPPGEPQAFQQHATHDVAFERYV